MKIFSIPLFLVTVLLGCTTSPPPTSSTTKRGIAFRALELEGAHWNRTKATRILDSLTRKISLEVLALPREAGQREILGTIHRAILKEGFRIEHPRAVTFGDRLMLRKFDCSDLTLIYIEVLEHLGITPKVALGRNHILIVLHEKDQSLFWETTTGKESTQSIGLEPLPLESALIAVYLEMAQKLSREKKNTEAELYYKKVLESHPRFVTGLQSFAAFFAKQSRFREAEPLLLKSIALDPTNPELYDFATALYNELNDTKQALEMCKKAFEYGTTNSRTLDSYFSLSMRDMLKE